MDLYDLRIQLDFPELSKKGYKNTSPPSVEYNCIAWAIGDNRKCWWPDPTYQYYWPEDIPLEDSLDAFIKLFQQKGYKLCNEDSFERGYEKIAIYTNFQKRVTHAARQLKTGKWTSKLGRNKDIEHTIEGLNSFEYGSVAQIMKRKT